MVITLQAKNPQAPQNIVRFDYTVGEYIPIKLGETMIDHLEIEVCCIFRIDFIPIPIPIIPPCSQPASTLSHPRERNKYSETEAKEKVIYAKQTESYTVISKKRFTRFLSTALSGCGSLPFWLVDAICLMAR